MGIIQGLFGKPHVRVPERKEYVSGGDNFGSIKGRTFAGIIGAHPDRASGDLIEGPSYVIDSLWRDVLGLTTGEVSTASVAAIGNDATGKRPQVSWKYRRSITRLENSLDLIEGICTESGLALFVDHQGRESLFAVDFATPQCTLDNSDAVWIDGRPQYRVRQTEVESIYNQFSLRYRFAHARGDFQGEVRCDENDSNLTDAVRPNDDGSGATYPALCDTSQTIYRKSRKLDVTADWIGDKSTAESLLKHLMNWLAIRKWVVEGDFAFTSETLALELGDAVQLDLDLLPTSVRTNNVFLVTRVVDGGGTRPGVVTLEFTMVPTVWGIHRLSGYGFNYGEDYGTGL